jgi:hypothetical protein
MQEFIRDENIKLYRKALASCTVDGAASASGC